MSPIEQYIDYHGETVTIITKAGLTSQSYDPEEDPQPSEPANDTVSITGLYGGIQTGELPQGCSGKFTIATAALPTDLVAQQSVLVRGGVACTIHSWRERVWEGVTDGWTLFLAA